MATTPATLFRIMKPGLYLLLFLVWTVYRVVHMSVLLARQATWDSSGVVVTSSSSVDSFGSDSPILAATVPPPPLRRQSPTQRRRSSSNLRTAAAAAATTTTAEAQQSEPSRCRSANARLMSQLNDPTITLTPCLPRNHGSAAYEEQQPQKPHMKKTKIWLTSFGWNHANQTVGITFPRSKRTRELLQAIVDHPDFEPRGWDDYHKKQIKGGGSSQSNSDDKDDVQHLVFLDVETCHEGNYPHYGRHDLNQDNDGGRPSEPHRWNLKQCYTANNCSALHKALQSPLFASGNKYYNARLVYLDCKGNGVTEAERKLPSHISFVSLSSHQSQLDHRKGGDQGLPPPVDATKFQLTAEELQQVQQCDESDRPYLLSFVGSIRRDSPRDRLVSLHNDIVGGGGGGNATTSGPQPHRQQRPIFAMSKADFAKQQREKSGPRTTYESLLRQSLFAAAPRGTNLFSYRFGEAIALGAIPVVHSDGWVLPFSPQVVKWSECAIIIPERRIQDTARILGEISPERRCQMRRACVDIYQRYMSSPAGTVQGILEGLMVPRSEP